MAIKTGEQILQSHGIKINVVDECPSDHCLQDTHMKGGGCRGCWKRAKKARYKFEYGVYVPVEGEKE